MDQEYDVVVVGGGTAGVVAAVQAGRAGASVLLVEKCGQLGGTMTVGGVPAPASFDSYGRQVIAGIGWELVTRAIAESGAAPPDFVDDPERPLRHLRVNIALYCVVADEAVRDAGVDLLLHTMLAEAAQAEGTWQLTLCTKQGLRPVRARVLIDCTGDANAAQLAGFPVDRHEPTQPATLVFRVGGYDPETLDYEALEQRYDQAVADGRMHLSDFGWGATRLRRFLRSRGGNANHVCGVDGATSEGKTAAELAGRQVMLRIYRFLRTLPGLENLTIEWMAPECGIRETVAIRGRATISAEDYISGRQWDDAVCYAYYAIDIHTTDGTEYQILEPGVVPTIPRGAMLPAGSGNLIVAGRPISGDRVAHSAFRVEATCMAMGQAAGAMAALAARTGTDPGELDLSAVHELLAEHGAIVPDVAAVR